MAAQSQRIIAIIPLGQPQPLPDYPNPSPVTSVGADPSPKPKPPPLTPKPAPSEIVKRLSFKRESGPALPEALTPEKKPPVVDEPPDKPPPQPPGQARPEPQPQHQPPAQHQPQPQNLSKPQPLAPSKPQPADEARQRSVCAARPSFRLDAPSQAPTVEHASPPPYLFESLPSVEYSRLEQEFEKLAVEEEDVPFMDDESSSEPIVETPRRPSQLDIPSRGVPARRHVAEEEGQSPETPSYSSRPLPLSPSGPLLAHISISSPDSSEGPDLTPTNSPSPGAPTEPSKQSSLPPALPSKPPFQHNQPQAPPLVTRSQSTPTPVLPTTTTPKPPSPSSPAPPLPSTPAPALAPTSAHAPTPANKPAPPFLAPAVPNLRLDSSSEDVEDEFQDELHFDPTISSGPSCVLGGGFRSTPVTVGVCPTPQPLTPAPTPRPDVPEKPVDEMTPTEADNLLADRLMERRSRAGSVLSDEQAEEVERLLSPEEPVPPRRSTSMEDTVDSGAPSLESAAVDKLDSLVYSQEEVDRVVETAMSDYVSADSYQLEDQLTASTDSVPTDSTVIVVEKRKPDAEPNPECYYDADADVHYFTDGHYWFETNTIDTTSPLENNPQANLHYKPPSRLAFSKAPVRQFSTHAVDDYDRRNDDVDPVAASAEYELEKRVEKMDSFPVELNKGPDGLGLSIIGMYSFTHFTPTSTTSP